MFALVASKPAAWPERMRHTCKQVHTLIKLRFATFKLGGEKLSDEKTKALELAMSQIERSFGKGSIMRLGERPPHLGSDVISTGSLAMDLALGVGGIPGAV